jgi:hypothetical protein
MARLLVLMITIGLADSINPTTIAPALYLASCQHPRVRVAEFTLGVFVVYLAGGAVIAVGGGQLVTHIVGDVDIRQTVRYTGEVVAGVLRSWSGCAATASRRGACLSPTQGGDPAHCLARRSPR